MPNGYQSDPLRILHDQIRDQGRVLLDLTRAAGRIEQRLTDGSEFHKEVKVHLDDHKERLAVIETKLEEDEPKSTAKRHLEAFRLLWPFIALSIAVIRVLLSMAGKEAVAKQLEWLLSFMAGFKTEG